MINPLNASVMPAQWARIESDPASRKPYQTTTPSEDRFEPRRSGETDELDLSSNREQNQAGQSAILDALEQNSRSSIPISAILKDFRSTINSLGIDASAQQEVDAYLNVVTLQAQKETPAVPLIQHSLRTAARTLDQFIGANLNQPSRVVQEWVEALLLQPVDYHLDAGLADTAIAVSTTPLAAGIQISGPVDVHQPAAMAEAGLLQIDGVEPIQPAAPQSLSQAALQAQSIRQGIESAKRLEQQGQTAQAITQLNALLPDAQSLNRPDVLGRVHRFMGRLYEAQNQPGDAFAQYALGAEAFAKANQLKAQHETLLKQAQVAESGKKWVQAYQSYRQAAIIADSAGQTTEQKATLWNTVGNMAFQGGQVDKAIAAWQTGLSIAQPFASSNALSVDLLSNLGRGYAAVQQYPKAHKAYQQALKMALSSNDTEATRHVALQWAQVYQTLNQPQAAQRLVFLARMQTVEPLTTQHRQAI